MIVTDVTQPEERDPSLDYEMRGAGLYADETLVQLDTGEFVAVSTRSERIPTSGATLVTAWARWCEQNGETILDTEGFDCENQHRHTFSPEYVETQGLDYCQRQVLMALLGEPNELALSSEVSKSIDIRNDIAVVENCRQQKSAGELLS